MTNLEAPGAISNIPICCPWSRQGLWRPNMMSIAFRQVAHTALSKICPVLYEILDQWYPTTLREAQGMRTDAISLDCLIVSSWPFDQRRRGKWQVVSGPTRNGRVYGLVS